VLLGSARRLLWGLLALFHKGRDYENARTLHRHVKRPTILSAGARSHLPEFSLYVFDARLMQPC